LLILFTADVDNVDVAKSFQISQAAKILSQPMGELVLLNSEAISSTGLIADVLASLHKSSGLTEYGTHMIQRLVESKIPLKTLVFTDILPMAASMTVNNSLIFSQAFDYYLGAGSSHLSKLYQLSHMNTKEADDTLKHYFLEGARLNNTARLVRTYSSKPTTISDQTVSPGETIILDLATASLDPKAYPSPTAVDLTRPVSSYLVFGDGLFQIGAQDLTLVAMTAMFKVVFGLKGLQRVPNSLGSYSGRGGGWVGWSQGAIKSVDVEPGVGVVEGGLGRVFLTEDWRGFVPGPTTMKVQWG